MFLESNFPNTAYNVTIKTPPAGQTCKIVNGKGIIRNADATKVQIVCTNSPYLINITGLIPGSSLVLKNESTKATQTLTVNKGYSVLAKTLYSLQTKAPAGKVCSVYPVSFKLTNANIAIKVTCTNQNSTIDMVIIRGRNNIKR